MVDMLHAVPNKPEYFFASTRSDKLQRFNTLIYQQ